MTVFNSTPLERKLAVLLGIPLNGVDPALVGTSASKSGSRKVFREAGVDCPRGFEDLRTQDDVEHALVELRRARPGLRRAVVKLNESFSGEGNAIFRYPRARSARAVQRRAARTSSSPWPRRRRTSTSRSSRGWAASSRSSSRTPEKASPSAQLRIDPHGRGACPSRPTTRSSAGPTGRSSSAAGSPPTTPTARSPGSGAHDRQAVLAAQRRGQPLRRRLPRLRGAGPRTSGALHALEINLRMGGTTHPFLALQFLTGGQLDAERAVPVSRRPGKYYRATDNLHVRAYRGLCPRTSSTS